MTLDDNDPEQQDLARRLAVLRVDPPDEAFFRAGLARRLAAAGSPVGWAPWAAVRRFFAARPGVAWPALGAATAVAVFALLMTGQELRHRRDPLPAAASPEVAEASYRVPVDKVALIRLQLSAAVTVEEVEFSIELPSGLYFWSGGAKLADRSFSWRGRLTAGDNSIPVAVRGERAGRYRVKVTARGTGGVLVQHHVVLDVQGAA